jgi:tRNA pseudouridine38-40 synthase
MIKYLLKNPGIRQIVVRRMEEQATTTNLLATIVPDENEPTESKRQKLEEPEDVKHKIGKKRKYALCLGYSGQGYYGLQRNATSKEFRTIEDEVVDGLVKIGSISQGHADEMNKMSFQRAARTDKGVSAAANLLSLKMELNEETTITSLNATLPKQIRVFSE